MRAVAVDLENYDPNLMELGNGAIRKDGSILVAGLYDGTEYYPCIPGTPSWQRLIDVMGDKGIVKVAHNGVYDYDWIQNGAGIPIVGKMEDTMTRAGLLDEYAGHYSLDACCIRAGLEGKNNEDTLERWWKKSGGEGHVMNNLMLIPPDIVAQYNKQDCISTYNLFMAQQEKLEAEQLLDANDLECEVLKVVLEMRKNGVRIDVPKVDDLRERTQHEVSEALEQLRKEYGLESLTKKKGPGTLPYVLTQLGLEDQLERTPTGELSTSATSLEGCNHPITSTIISLKRKQTLLDKYLNSAFTKFCIGDRIHGTFKPTQRDDGGTITSRFSSSEPNMQNFSARLSKGGDLVRGVFLPDEGCWLTKCDYSQIEYRILAHYAVGPGSSALRDAYINHDADFHKFAQEMIGFKGPDARRIVKTLNFGVTYGMGRGKFVNTYKVEARQAAAAVGKTPERYLSDAYDEYFRRMTFMRPTSTAIQALCKRDSFVRSIDNRKHRAPPGEEWYKIVNYLIQGDAAIVNKMGLVKAHQSGVFDVLKLHLTVHDEAVCSVPKTKEGLQAVQHLVDSMTHVYDFKVPLKVEPGLGKNWFTAGEDSGKRVFELMCNRLGA